MPVVGSSPPPGDCPPRCDKHAWQVKRGAFDAATGKYRRSCRGIYCPACGLRELRRRYFTKAKHLRPDWQARTYILHLQGVPLPNEISRYVRQFRECVQRWHRKAIVAGVVHPKRDDWHIHLLVMAPAIDVSPTGVGKRRGRPRKITTLEGAIGNYDAKRRYKRDGSRFVHGRIRDPHAWLFYALRCKSGFPPHEQFPRGCGYRLVFGLRSRERARLSPTKPESPTETSLPIQGPCVPAEGLQTANTTEVTPQCPTTLASVREWALLPPTEMRTMSLNDHLARVADIDRRAKDLADEVARLGLPDLADGDVERLLALRREAGLTGPRPTPGDLKHAGRRLAPGAEYLADAAQRRGEQLLEAGERVLEDLARRGVGGLASLEGCRPGTWQSYRRTGLPCVVLVDVTALPSEHPLTRTSRLRVVVPAAPGAMTGQLGPLPWFTVREAIQLTEALELLEEEARTAERQQVANRIEAERVRRERDPAVELARLRRKVEELIAAQEEGGK